MRGHLCLHMATVYKWEKLAKRASHRFRRKTDRVGKEKANGI